MRVSLNEGGRGFTFYLNTGLQVLRVYIVGEIFLVFWGDQRWSTLRQTYDPIRFEFTWKRETNSGNC